ncbi:hypothetical protein TrLO_g9562 [Triparma laevis f. longispina]|uniref:Uncharacterized protein n=1 Tax=Triparma laevis f. longispina TaxID=1714387 RepID=A0A9W6ZA22_9STRA|nr:hypothetical protein TrLO_g9562 [Triparma laevis f. longispina]
MMEKAGVVMDRLGFAKGNFDGGLKSIIDDFRLTEEIFDEEKIEKKIEETETKNAVKYGHEIPYTYANLIKNLALIFTFGLASSFTAWIGCIGILFRWLALSFLAKRYQKKMEERGEQESETDAQGIPFRCIVLVVICNFGFFATLALLAGVTVGEEEKGGGGWTVVFSAVMIVALVSQIML